MENSILTDLHVDSESHGYLSEAARWAKFIAIVGLVGASLMILMGLLSLLIIPSAMVAPMDDAYRMGMAVSRGFIMIFYVAGGIIAIMPSVYMLRFSSRMKAALLASDQDSLTSSFASLKSWFKFNGVILIIVLSFIALGIVIAIIGLAVASQR